MDNKNHAANDDRICNVSNKTYKILAQCGNLNKAKEFLSDKSKGSGAETLKAKSRRRFSLDVPIGLHWHLRTPCGPAGISGNHEASSAQTKGRRHSLAVLPPLDSSLRRNKRKSAACLYEKEHHDEYPWLQTLLSGRRLSVDGLQALHEASPSTTPSTQSISENIPIDSSSKYRNDTEIDQEGSVKSAENLCQVLEEVQVKEAQQNECQTNNFTVTEESEEDETLNQSVPNLLMLYYQTSTVMDAWLVCLSEG